MAEEGQVISCDTIQQWREIFEKEKNSQKLVVVEFTASWSGPCGLMAPVVADLAKKMTNVLFLTVDVDEVKGVAEEWSVESIPTFIFLKEGKLVDTVVGGDEDHLQTITAAHATTTD